MVRARDFLIRGVQVVAFTSSGDFESSRVLTTVLGKHGPLFSGRVEVLPLPDEVPPEIPRVELGSKDNRWALSASPARTSVVWVERETAGIPSEQLAERVQQCSGILSCCFPDDSPVRVNRLGILVTNVVETDDAPRILIEQFCQPRCHASESPQSPLRHSQKFQLHNFKTFESTLDKMPINSWVRCKTGSLGPEGPPAIIVEQDLNTTADESERHFKANEIQEYFQGSVPESQQILRLYFPD